MVSFWGKHRKSPAKGKFSKQILKWLFKEELSCSINKNIFDFCVLNVLNVVYRR